MTDLEQQIERMRIAYDKLPAFVRAQGAAFFSQVLTTFDAVAQEARELRAMVEEIR